MKKYFLNVCYIISSILIVMLINYDFKWKISWYSFILGIGIFFLFKNFQRSKINVGILINAFIFAMFLEVGVCFQKGKSLAYLVNNINTFLIGILSLFVFTFVLYILLFFIFKKFQNMKSIEPKSKVLKSIFYERPFLFSFLFIISISALYLVFYYPGSMAYDGMWQLDFYYNIRAFSDHHPAVLTLIMGFLMDWGRNILNDNLGMFLYILPQVIINALIYAYVLKIMNKMETPFWIRLISLIFFGLFPLLVMNSITYIKDTIFYLLFLLLFVYMYYHFRVNYEEEKKSKYIILGLLYLGLYLTRNTGFYITLIMSIVMALISIKKRKKIVIGFSILAVFIISVHVTYQKVFLPKMNIDKASVREMMSVPFQQTARYLKYHPEDLSKKERKVLEDLFAVDLKEVARIYNPNRSDNVKWEFKKYPSNKELKEYIEVWFSMFWKHPFTYIDATINNIYGYFYPNVLNFIGEELGFYYIYVKGPVNTGEFNLYWNGLKNGREALEGIASKISKTDGIKLLYAPAFYVWILISASFYLIINKKSEVLAYFVSLFVVLLCAVISPVNGHMRYVQPIMVSAPFILAIIYNETKKN